MSQKNDVTILDKLLVVNLDVHIWSARKKLMPLDLGQAELPPEELEHPWVVNVFVTPMI